jgi:hypothetical protein
LNDEQQSIVMGCDKMEKKIRKWRQSTGELSVNSEGAKEIFNRNSRPFSKL